jgi:hypothetical protein
VRKACRSYRVAVACVAILAAGRFVGMGAESPDNGGGPVVMRRLTEVQYRNIISDVFGDTVTLGGRFEPDLRVNQLVAVGTGMASVTAAGLEQYDKIARSIAEQVVDPSHRGQMIDCAPASASAPDDACTSKFLTRLGRLLYRRPVFAAELRGYINSAAVASRKTGDFYNGLALALAAMLESPPFLFRVESSEPDPAHPGQGRVDSYSKAQRLSFLFWNTAPDSALLTAAQKGELQTSAGLAQQVNRLMASPRLETGVRAFFTDMLQFDSFDTLAKDSALFPKFTFALAAQAQEQTLRTLVDLLIRRNGDYREVFTTRDTFLTPLLGSLYRVPVVAQDGLPGAWVPYEFQADSGQSGILTQASFVALHSHPGQSSPTLRGRAVREILLCTKVPDPPGDVDFTRFKDQTGPARTARERLLAHRANPSCAGCHKIMDPIGLTLETFDGAGGPRENDNSVPIDTSGELDGMSFTGAAGLGRALHDNPRTPTCLVERAFDYALGRVETEGEKRWRMEYLNDRFAADGYRFPALLRTIALSDTYYRVLPSETPAGAPNVAVVQSKTGQEKRK